MARNYKQRFEAVDGIKKCTKCLVDKPVSEFHLRKGKHLNGREVINSHCKKCAHKCTVDAHKKNPNHQEMRYFWHIKKTYGLTPAKYYEMLTRQSGCCAICSTVPDLAPKTKRLDFHVDHCHATGEVRGLLCSHCNTTLGHSKEDIDRLLGCAIYLENFRNKKL